MTRWLLIAAFVSVTALAVAKGGTLYVRTQEARLLEAPDLKARPLATLPLGAKVVWRGASTQNRHLHEVEWREGTKPPVTGYVFQGALGPSAPQSEFLTAGNTPVDVQAFKSSGAATKALSGAALDYAASKNLEEQARRLMAIEAINASITPERRAERAQRLGLALEQPPPEPPPPPPPAAPKKPSRKGKKS